ncbi:MAG: hypothetical protein E7324_08720 [Clostridiales bacterium]|nr:hypothetical protein [Clostridiales bacterium]
MKREEVKSALDRALSGIQENPYLYQKILQGDGERKLHGHRRRILVLAVLVMVLSAASISIAVTAGKRVINWQGEEIESYPTLLNEQDTPVISEEERSAWQTVTEKQKETLIFAQFKMANGRSDLSWPSKEISTLEELNVLLAGHAPYLPAIREIPGYWLETGTVNYGSDASKRPALSDVTNVAGGVIYQYEILPENAIPTGYSLQLTDGGDPAKRIAIHVSVSPVSPDFVVLDDTAVSKVDVQGMDEGLMMINGNNYSIFLRKELEEPVPMYYYFLGWNIEQCRYIECRIYAKEYLEAFEEMIYFVP